MRPLGGVTMKGLGLFFEVSRWGSFLGPLSISGVCALDPVGGIGACSHVPTPFSSICWIVCVFAWFFFFSPRGFQVPSFFFCSFCFYFSQPGCHVAQDGLKLVMQQGMPPPALPASPPPRCWVTDVLQLLTAGGFQGSSDCRHLHSQHPTHPRSLPSIFVRNK